MNAKAVYIKKSDGSYGLLGYLFESKDDVGSKGDDIDYATIAVEDAETKEEN